MTREISTQKILLIENDFVYRELYSAAFSAQEHEVIVAANGNTALKILGQQPSISCVVLNVFLLIMDSSNFLKRLSSTPFGVKEVFLYYDLEEKEFAELKTLHFDTLTKNTNWKFHVLSQKKFTPESLTIEVIQAAD